jgi:hypothetical protein
MKIFVLLLALCLSATAFAQVRTITQAEWFADTDPGIGLANPITIGTPSSSTSLNFVVSTNSLAPGLHRVLVRTKSNTGVWGQPNPALITIRPGSSIARLVTAYEYSIDNGTPTLVDNPDAAQFSINQLINTVSVSAGVHKLNIRCRDDLGYWGSLNAQYFFVFVPSSSLARTVTHIQYWFDNNAPTLVDVADGAMVNINQLLSTSGLSIGLHQLSMQARDDLGRWGAVDKQPLVIISPFGVSQARRITAAEFYVNNDPGAGNGVPIPLPQDGIWDNSQETVIGLITGLPIGLHLVGFRAKDDLGRWSKTVRDTLIVGPVLTVRQANANVVLDWKIGNGADKYYIFRSDSANGTWVRYDSTTARSYTDVNPLNPHSYYYVTFKTNTLSTFRLPDVPANAVKD